MNIPHEAYTTFLKVSGYKSYQDAINKLGGTTKFRNAVRENYHAQKLIETEIKSPKPTVKITTPKEIHFSKGYIIYPDGKCYSEKTKKYLKAVKIHGKRENKFYYYYDLSPYGKCLVSRLVMFYFAVHDYSDIADMPKVTFKDGDPGNCNVNNLLFATQSEINIKYNIKVPEHCNIDKGTIKEKELERVKSMLSIQMTYPEIAKVLNTSPMAVYRFVKKTYQKNHG